MVNLPFLLCCFKTRSEKKKEEEDHDMSAEEVTAVPDVVSDVADNSPANEAAASSSSSSKKKDNSYYYWHGHEKERAKVGDVAPKTSPLLVKSEALAPEHHRSPLLATRSITKYSWCNNTKSVSVYVDLDGVHELPQENVKVDFDVKKLSVHVKGTDGVSSVLLLRLAKDIAAEKSSFRFKPNQIVIKLDKGDSDATWYDLVDNKATTEDE